MRFFKWTAVFIITVILAFYGWIYSIIALALLMVGLVLIDAYKEASAYKKAQYKADKILAAQIKGQVERHVSPEHLYEGLRCRKRVRKHND